MRRGLSFFGMLLVLLLQTGCADRMDIENLSLALVIGLDLNDDNRLEISMASPVFSKEAKRKTEVYTTNSIALRASQDEFDKTFKAFTVGGKTQVFLIGKKLMRHEAWFNLLDTFLRDPKNSTTNRIVLVDGPVSQVIRYNPQDKPRLPIYLTYLIDTASRRNLCIRTTLQELRSISFDKGMTASVTEIRFNNGLYIPGSALLSENGTYKLSIKGEETRLLRMLQGEKSGEFKFTFEHEGMAPSDGIVPQNIYTVSAVKYAKRVKTGFSQDRFTFDFHFKIRIFLLEKLFSLNVMKNEKEFQAEMEKNFEERFQRLIRKFQQAKIDPIGLGQFARAYGYDEWKQVENKWPEAMSRADFNVKVEVIVAAMGAIQ